MGRRRNNPLKHSQQFKRSQAFQAHLMQMNQMLSSFNLVIQDVDADGNCLFRSIANQLDGLDSAHSYYRTIACEELQSKKAFYQDFIEEKIEDYIKDMRKSGTWGDHLVLQALCEALNINIAVHSLEGVFVVGDSKYTTAEIGTSSFWQRILLRVLSQCQQLQTLYIKLTLKCRKKKPKFRRIIHIAFLQGELFPEHYSSIRVKSAKIKMI